MLNSKLTNMKQMRILSLLILALLFFLSSCLPQQAPQSIQTGNSTSTGNEQNIVPYSEPTFPLSGIFVQDGLNQSANYFSLPLNFSDSFLIRGNSLSKYLRTLPNTTKFCVVGKYNFTSGVDKFLILSGKPKSYTDLVNKTSEFYLQVEPSNHQANMNDCLTLTSNLFTGSSAPVAYFNLTQLCATCNSSVTSEGLKLYFPNGENVPTLNLSSLALTISGSTSSEVNTCTESTICQTRGYNCCLEGQCVNDGAEKPGANLLSGYSEAKTDVQSNPERFVLYPQFYFVCNNRPEVTGSDETTQTGDPNYQASIRLMELTQLYQCLNKVDGEFSYCTMKFNDASLKVSSGTPFSASDNGIFDDINFQNLNPNFATGDYANNIVKIFYAGQVLFEANKTTLSSSDGFFTSAGNDNLSSAQSVKILKSLPANAQDDNLYLTYKIDGSCEKLGTSLARCTKTYIHNSSDATSPSYHNNTKNYYLPSYADTSSSANIIVKISGVVVPEEAATWYKATSFAGIIFSASYPLFQNQTVEITYYINSPSSVSALLASKAAAQAQVNSMCICASNAKCNLKPLTDSEDQLINYECIQTSVTSNEPPANQTVFVSNKNIPHRYFDVNGVSYDEDYSSALDQEGTAFSYKNSDKLKPSNLDSYTGYTGFNEIYGSFSKTNPGAARPAKMIKVKKDKIYDLFTNSGIFQSCLTCGSDYYSSLQYIFPQSLNSIGGGYSPDNFNSSRTKNNGSYRSDDLLFGRACFIPATMIPWTHTSALTVKDQRTKRLAGQHFLFANGYNKDWYGFDYGSLIGSFDGITWFSIGNMRRIKATTNKLYLAVNAYFGDLNSENNFNVTISESTIYSSPMPDHDTETSGAECQKSHFCSTDNDCFRQVGYDYTCQNIGTITTNWPVTDANGTEIIGATSKTLVSILGGTNGQSKRCVYRGRGTPCHSDLTSINSTFNSSSITGLLACSTNSMCQQIGSGASNRFNDRISRFANTPVAQNIATTNPTDTHGLGARILGRPFDFYGTKTIPTASTYSLNANSVAAICIPGKNISSSLKTYDLNALAPASRTDSSDKILGIGTTLSGLQSPKYLNSCPATDSIGVSIQQYDLPLGDQSTINTVTAAQNLSSNLLNLPAITAQNIFSSTNNSQISSIGYQRNTCLRAAGASCFSDMDCAPSEFIANKVKNVDLTGILNTAEQQFWKEELICGNPEFKYVQSGVLNTATFNIKNNVCCRDFGKTFSVLTETNTSDYHWCDQATSSVKVAGLNTNINSYNRYSRVHTAYDKMTCDSGQTSTKSFALSLKASTNVQRYIQQQTQYKTLDTVNSRTCCTKNWVRNFHSENGGGHTWSASKLQTIDKKNFVSLNWVENNPGSDNVTHYYCESTGYNNQTCEIRNFSNADVDLYLKFFGGLELTGIPQAALISQDQVFKLNNGEDGSPAMANEPVDGTFDNTVPTDYENSSTKKLYSGSNYSALQSQLKKVFSEDDFSCCIPSGKQVPDTTKAEQCCTGYLGNTGSQSVLRCCMPDFTDLTVYLSRYVSSEGRGLPDSAYDPDTGYIKDPAIVKMIAAQKNLCCSGEVMTGLAIRRLYIPIEGDLFVPSPNAATRRFVYLDSAVDNNSTVGPIGQLYDKGLRWNNHLYCVPRNLTVPAEL